MSITLLHHLLFFHFGRRPSDVRRTSIGRPTDEILKKLEKMLKLLEKMLKSCCYHMNIVLGQKNVIFFNGGHTMIIFFISPALEHMKVFSLFTSWHGMVIWVLETESMHLKRLFDALSFLDFRRSEKI